MGLNDYKDNRGRTDIPGAIGTLSEVRDKLKMQGGNSSALNNELQYRPLKPSEIFLSKTGNIFPISEIKDRIATLEEDSYSELLEKKVSLYFDTKQPYGVNYKLDAKGDLTAINTYPWDDTNREGCVVIYDFPELDKNGLIPKDMYIIGHDPYASDDPNGESVASIYVLKTKKYMGTHPGEHDTIVASYIGRPFEGREIVNEILMKLSMFYGNAKVYFENVRGNVKEYFEKMKRLDLLARQPQTLFNKKSRGASNASQIYGYPMSSRVMKLEGLQYIRD